MKCKNGQEGCGQFYYCGACREESRRAAYARLTPEQKNYDNIVDPLEMYHTDYDRDQCSCHICAPCDYCVNKDEEGDKCPGGQS